MCSEIINLCSTCRFQVPTCLANNSVITFAEDIYPETKGTALVDAVVKCSVYKKNKYLFNQQEKGELNG